MRIWIVVLLLGANALAFAWWQGYLAPLWPAPGAGEREPERLSRQLQPDSVNIVGPRLATSGPAGTAIGNAASAPGSATPQ